MATGVTVTVKIPPVVAVEMVVQIVVVVEGLMSRVEVCDFKSQC